ncbi:dihydroorotase [[Clostridium] colinum]|uniref:dihydroorotase n=1 Tax=[Clostridium] colinum TaxID=36835 RepID=UPI0020246C1B|nr:dihydroorotase [[Clostridium] colinum]
MNLLIKNAKIVSNGIEEKEIKDIYIEDGIIKTIDKNINIKDIKTVDAKNNYVLPGFIDIGCRVFENGYESKDNIIRLTQAGAKGGYTTITTSSSAKPIVDNKTVVEYISSKCKEGININLYPTGNITKGGEGKQISEIGEMVLTGVVAISDGEKAIEDTKLLRDVFLYSRMFDITVMTTLIEPNLSKGGMINYGCMATKLGLAGIPKEAEEIEASKNIILAKHTGAKVHISYVTTKGTVELIRQAKKEGVNITCSTAPHYFTLTDRAIDNYNTFAKVMPPLREEEDIEAIKEGLRDGTIDTIVSGHSPSLYEKKATEFERSEFGLSGLEVAFNITNTKLIKEDTFSLKEITKLMSKNPANILGFKTKGEIKEGYDADIIILDTKKEKIIKSSEFLSRAKYSPYENLSVFGDILATIVGGNVLYNN